MEVEVEVEGAQQVRGQRAGDLVDHQRKVWGVVFGELFGTARRDLTILMTRRSLDLCRAARDQLFQAPVVSFATPCAHKPIINTKVITGKLSTFKSDRLRLL